MNSELTHADIESLLGAYALDAVEPEETAAIEAHLETCPRCRAEVDSHREMAAAMGNSFEELPEGLWDRIAADLGEADSRPQLVPPAPLPPQAQRLAPVPTPPAAPPVPDELAAARERRGARTLRRVTVAVVSVAAAVIALLAFSLVSANDKVSRLQAASSGTASAALQSAGHQVVNVTTPSGAQLASFVLTRGGRGYLLHSSMPGLPQDQTYQLWAMIGGRAISLGLMGNSPGQASFTVSSGTPVSSLAVTVEPAGGSVEPHQPAVGTGKVVA